MLCNAFVSSWVRAVCVRENCADTHRAGLPANALRAHGATDAPAAHVSARLSVLKGPQKPHAPVLAVAVLPEPSSQRFRGTGLSHAAGARPRPCAGARRAARAKAVAAGFAPADVCRGAWSRHSRPRSFFACCRLECGTAHASAYSGRRWCSQTPAAGCRCAGVVHAPVRAGAGRV